MKELERTLTEIVDVGKKVIERIKASTQKNKVDKKEKEK